MKESVIEMLKIPFSIEDLTKKLRHCASPPPPRDSLCTPLFFGFFYLMAFYQHYMLYPQYTVSIFDTEVFFAQDHRYSLDIFPSYLNVIPFFVLLSL